MNRADPELDEVWRQFHLMVNMTSPELRDWLFNTPEGVDSYAPEEDVDVHTLGDRVLRIMEKRRTDATDADVGVMREVCDLISSRLQNPPPDDTANQPWRDTLMTLGHDPMKADSPRGPDLET